MNSKLVKGILLALVIIDHNDFSRLLFPGFLQGLSFHVVAFFALPYLRAAAPLSIGLAQRHFLRSYYPFLIVALSTATVFWVATGRPFATMSEALMKALYNGNADSLKQSTNMYLLWFLPSFFCFSLVKSLLDTVPPAFRNMLLGGTGLAHITVGAVAADIQHVLPLGVLPALYILPLAAAAANLHARAFAGTRKEYALAAAVTLFIAAKFLQMHMGLSQEVGFSLVADYRELPALLVNDLEALTGTLMVFQAGRFAWPDVLAAAGQFSLQVYLFHAFVAKVLYRIIVTLPFPLDAGAACALSSLATLLLTTAGARWVTERQMLRRLMFPAMQARAQHDAPVHGGDLRADQAGRQ
jgi:fucose 4-O-acetylase-like acetyltransferase